MPHMPLTLQIIKYYFRRESNSVMKDLEVQIGKPLIARKGGKQNETDNE
ncbi:MAG: hypothetical protein HQ551_10805 [Desulfobacteraceae bacterium]|nr:hypothetical protein [Desulfobacteraceae bacterium]